MGRELFAGPLFSEREASHTHVQPSSLLEPHNQGLLRHRHDFLESPSIQPVASPNFSKFQDAYNSYNIMVSFTSGPLGFLIASIQDEWQAFLHNIYIHRERLFRSVRNRKTQNRNHSHTAFFNVADFISHWSFTKKSHNRNLKINRLFWLPKESALTPGDPVCPMPTAIFLLTLLLQPALSHLCLLQFPEDFRLLTLYLNEQFLHFWMQLAK